ncbi:uncharacterized protein LOC124673698 [Lolium rigidum]|uniref:uncharacterized protein LOC124673698 n=1 Tax=Lolium rigidum TaxID=89674 RepID=UPI001F5CC342|nr:uncharacterized protein LOC124673698 [Lolium rigidum]
MEVAMSAVTGELVSRFISFLMKKYHSSSHAQSDEKKMVERLQSLLIRVSTIIEEADGQYITNTGMIMQLKMISEAMYRGYHVLDTLRYKTIQHIGFNEVSNDSPSSLHLAIPLKRSRKTTNKHDKKAAHLGALESLEIVVDNMVEFVVLLGGCERMSRRPYDIYLYTDNFMFSRHAEKQRLLSFLLQQNNPLGDCAPAVLPIIGGTAVGKKTLVAHACGDERVRSRFPSVLHLNGDNFMRIDQGRTMFGMMLIIIEFSSDIGDDDWKKFRSFSMRMSRGSKIVIVGRLTRLARFGSVKPIFLSALTYDELRYLFKTLAFGSTDPEQHPRLLHIVDEFTEALHSTQGSLVSANTFADVLRNNLNVQFWRCMLDMRIKMVNRNLYKYGVEPTLLIDQGHSVDITDYVLHPLSVTRYKIDVSINKEMPIVKFGELVADPSIRPKQDFILVSWESRMPPHNSFSYFVTSQAQDRHDSSALPGRKRRGVLI